MTVTNHTFTFNPGLLFIDGEGDSGRVPLDFTHKNATPLFVQRILPSRFTVPYDSKHLYRTIQGLSQAIGCADKIDSVAAASIFRYWVLEDKASPGTYIPEVLKSLEIEPRGECLLPSPPQGLGPEPD